MASHMRETKSGVTDGVGSDISFSEPKECFPWSRLPPELRVKILQNLPRSVLNRFRRLNRETFELIRHNEQRMRKWLIDEVDITVVSYEDEENSKIRLFVRCEEEKQDVEVTFGSNCVSVCNLLRKVLKNANIHHLTIIEELEEGDLLGTIFSIVQDAGCRVHKLDLNDTIAASISSSTLLRFLCDVAATSIRVVTPLPNILDPDVISFIITRRHFWVGYDDFTGAVPVGDSTLARITATVFIISAPNMITIDGLRSFVELLASGQRRIEYGKIYTNFSLENMSFPAPPNGHLEVFHEIEWMDEMDLALNLGFESAEWGIVFSTEKAMKDNSFRWDDLECGDVQCSG